MKIILTVFLSIFLSKGCAQEQEIAEVKVVYGANTRGYHRIISIENNTFSLISKRDEKPSVISLSEEQWSKIVSLYSKIDLKSFNDLEGATMERAYDGKPHADMSIITKDKTYTTKGFDHTIPPTKIKEFVDYINQLADDAVSNNPILGSYSVESLLSNDIKEKNYFISFDAEKISGFMGCNMYSGTYELNDDSIAIGALVATRKYCQDKMEHETTWMKIAPEVTNYKLDNKTISLFDTDGKLLLKATKK